MKFKNQIDLCLTLTQWSVDQSTNKQTRLHHLLVIYLVNNSRHRDTQCTVDQKDDSGLQFPTKPPQEQFRWQHHQRVSKEEG